MTKLILGVVTGILGTVLVYQAFDGDPVETSPPVPTEPVTAVAAEPEPVAAEPAPLPIERPVDDGAALAAAAEPGGSIEEGEGASEFPPAIPITLPPEFEWVSSEAWHRAFERELFDPDWSAETQASITRYFAERPELTSKYGVPTVHCRQTGCEVLIVAYDLDESNFVNQLARDLMESGYAEQPWASQLLGMIGGSNHEDGISTMVFVLSRL